MRIEVAVVSSDHPTKCTTRHPDQWIIFSVYTTCSPNANMVKDPDIGGIIARTAQQKAPTRERRIPAYLVPRTKKPRLPNQVDQDHP